MGIWNLLDFNEFCTLCCWLAMLGLHCLFSVVLVVGLVCGFGCVVCLIVYLCGWLSCLRDVVLVIDRCVTFRADCFVVVLWVF